MMRRFLMPSLLVVSLIGPLFAIGWYSFSLQRESLRDSIEFEVERMMHHLATGMVDPVWNLIPDAGRPLLDALMEEGHVVAIEVESTALGRFLAAEKDRAQDASVLWLERDIERNGVVIGRVRVGHDIDQLYAPMEAQWWRIVLVSIGEAMLVLVIVFWLFRLSSRLQRATVLRETNLSLQQEIAERKQAEENARASRDQLSLITNNLPVNISYVDAKGRLRFANRVWYAWNQWSPETALGQSLEALVSGQYEKISPYVAKVLEGEQQVFETQISHRDGRTRTISVVYVPHKGADGAIEGFFSLAEDITEAKVAEERHRQAQKLEAIGRLTGGVAHDFNNLLAVIQGNTELLANVVGADNRSVEAVLRAAGRGAELTQRLLAYSRQQPLRPEPVDLAVLVDHVTGLLVRTIGGAIEVSTHIDDDLWLALADPGQVQDAILNLAINARDAMPGGGRLTITCGNVHLDAVAAARAPDAVAGDFIALSVSDTGTGMSADVRGRAFEPFFTTKDVGQGSGLGLSMVEGFARQSGGHATIDSTLGEGTTVTLYLPRIAEAQSGVHGQPAESPGGQAEVILVVEDDADVRALTVEMLTSLGYRVIDVADARDAELALAAGERIDLALSDVVLPGGVSGPQFVAGAKKRFPGLRVVFMSGYSAEVLSADWHLPDDDDCVLLSKPFQRSQLAQTISTALRH